MTQIGIKTRGAVCFIDDEEFFINSMKLMLEQHFKVVGFTSTKQAKERLIADNKSLIAEERLLSEIASTEDTRALFRQTLKWLLGTKRHDVIQTCFSDFTMPEMDGVTLLGQIENSRIQRVLLTGRVASVEAIDAFNANEIDAYLPKQSDDLVNKVRAIAKNGAKRKLDGIWRSLDIDLQQAYDNKFTRDAVMKRLDSAGVVEHILLPHPTGFLCLCAYSQVKWFQLETNASQVGAVEILRDAGASRDVLEDLMSGELAAAVELTRGLPGMKTSSGYPMAALEVVCLDPWVGIAEFNIPTKVIEDALRIEDDDFNI